jgi:hypothetical protein
MLIAHIPSLEDDVGTQQLANLVLYPMWGFQILPTVMFTLEISD